MVVQATRLRNGDGHPAGLLAILQAMATAGMAAVVEAVEVVSVVVAAGEYIVSNHTFDCVL